MTQSNNRIQDIVDTWQQYVSAIIDWEKIVAGINPKQTPCGPVYELPASPINRTETFAIADMRSLKVAMPHYHANGETEIYIVIQGEGLTVVGGEEHKLRAGTVVVTPTNTAHYTIPGPDLVMAVINAPHFSQDNVVDVETSDPDVGFGKAQFERLTVA